MRKIYESVFYCIPDAGLTIAQDWYTIYPTMIRNITRNYKIKYRREGEYIFKIL